MLPFDDKPPQVAARTLRVVCPTRLSVPRVQYAIDHSASLLLSVRLFLVGTVFLGEEKGSILVNDLEQYPSALAKQQPSSVSAVGPCPSDPAPRATRLYMA